MKRVLTLTASLSMLSLMGTASGQDSPFVATTVNNIDASGNDAVYFDLDNSDVVDGDSSAWELSFKGTTVSVRGSVLMVDRKFDSVYEAPEAGYIADSSGISSLPSDANQRWFMYDMNTHIVEPVPHRTYVFRTSDGRHGKLEILGYYKDGVLGDTPGAEPRYFSFRYYYRLDESSRLD